MGLVSEAELRKKYVENDWGFLVGYVKTNLPQVMKGFGEKPALDLTRGYGQAETYGKDLQYVRRYCAKDSVKRIRLVRAWDRWHDLRVCPICWDWVID